MGKGKQFDLSAMMGVVSNLDTISGPQVRMIPLEDILDNKANFYKVDKEALEPLADSIAMDGLQQYPVVMPHPEKEGKYLLLSGHRRCAAIRLLAEEGREDLRMVPCTIRQYRSEAMADLQLILANSTARVLTSAEIAKQAERMEMLLYQLKEEGYEFPGRMRDQVAAACKVSAPKLARLKVIREKLKAPEFLLLFEEDRLPEQTAYALARLPEEFQKRLAGIQPDIAGYVAEIILRKYKEGWRWDPSMQCPDGKNCKRGDSFLRHDLECPSWEMCGGNTCCLACERAKTSYSPCGRMCGKAQALRKENQAGRKAAAEQQIQKQVEQYQKETSANARRVLLAAEAAGLPENKFIAWGYGGATVEKLRKYAGGIFPEGEQWYGAKFSPRSLSDPAKTARQLGCSTDYLLGLTDNLAPVAAPSQEDAIPAEIVETLLEETLSSTQEIHPVWLSGTPEKSGPVAAQHQIPDGGPAIVTLCWYDAEGGTFRFSREGETIDAECTGWWPVPDAVDKEKA